MMYHYYSESYYNCNTKKGKEKRKKEEHKICQTNRNTKDYNKRTTEDQIR